MVLSRIREAANSLRWRWTFRQLVCRIVAVVLVTIGYLVMHCAVTENGHKEFRSRLIQIIPDKTGKSGATLRFRVVEERAPR